MSDSGRAGTRLHVIINPAAGHGRAAKQWPSIADTLARHGYLLYPHLTEGPGDATAIAQLLVEQGVETIVCAGGDGTVNEVVNGLLAAGRPATELPRLGIVPCGTGKDLGRSLGTRHAEALAGALDAGSTLLMDAGKATYVDPRTGYLSTRYFVNVADAGLGAETAERINNGSKALGGFVSYLKGAVHTIAVFQPWQVEVEVDGVPLYRGTSGIVVFANGRFFAGGMLVAPDASLCDGLLDIFVLAGASRRVLLTSLLPRIYRGKHVGYPGVVSVRGRRAEVRATASMPLEMDGEQAGGTPVTVEVVPRALPVAIAPDAPAGWCSCSG